MENDESGFKPHLIKWDDQKINRIWDYYGSSDIQKLIYFGETAGRHFVRVLKRNALFINVKKIIDFSCGTGAIIEALLKTLPEKITIEGYDPSSLSVKKANQRNNHKPNFLGAKQINAYPTLAKSGSADLVILTEVIEHLDNDTLHLVLTECHRVLSPGGKLIITTPNDECLERSNTLCPECGCTFHIWQHQRNWNRESLGILIKSSGFKIRKIKEITWGNELIELAFIVSRRKNTGLLAIAVKN